VGFISRRVIPRKVRRAMHPARTAKNALTPRPVKKVLRVSRAISNPVSSASYAIERSLATKVRSTSKASAYGNCTVAHRSADTAARCSSCRSSTPVKTELSNAEFKVCSVMFAFIFAGVTIWIPDVGLIVAAGWMYSWLVLAFAPDPSPHSVLAPFIFLGLLLWLVPVAGPWLAGACLVVGLIGAGRQFANSRQVPRKIQDIPGILPILDEQKRND
jgi:hypothetical protein